MIKSDEENILIEKYKKPSIQKIRDLIKSQKYSVNESFSISIKQNYISKFINKEVLDYLNRFGYATEQDDDKFTIFWFPKVKG
jgi:hypothetical protein